MSTLGAELRKGIPELFFVVTAIKACYGRLPAWDAQYREGSDEEDEEEEEEEEDEEEEGGGYEERGGGSPAKRGRFYPRRERSRARPLDTLDSDYARLYGELRDKALSDVKTLVRERVEGMSTASASYEFMNMYGTCSFDPPGVAAVSGAGGGAHACKFTKVAHSREEPDSTGPNVVSVSGVLNPILSARVGHGELELSPCCESDWRRATEEFTRLESRRRMRVPRVYKGDLGSTLGSMENPFVFAVREDLHLLGCRYRDILVTIELLHLNMLHAIYS